MFFFRLLSISEHGSQKFKKTLQQLLVLRFCLLGSLATFSARFLFKSTARDSTRQLSFMLSVVVVLVFLHWSLVLSIIHFNLILHFFHIKTVANKSAFMRKLSLVSRRHRFALRTLLLDLLRLDQNIFLRINQSRFRNPDVWFLRLSVSLHFLLVFLMAFEIQRKNFLYRVTYSFDIFRLEFILAYYHRSGFIWLLVAVSKILSVNSFIVSSTVPIFLFDSSIYYLPASL